MIPKLLNKVIFGCENSVDNVTGWTLCALSENVCPDIGYAQTKFYEKVQLQKNWGYQRVKSVCMEWTNCSWGRSAKKSKGNFA